MNETVNLRHLFSVEDQGIAKIIEWCMEMQLLTRYYECPECNEPMDFKEEPKALDKYEWVCKSDKHSVNLSIRQGTWFESSSMSIMNILFVTYSWLKKFPIEFLAFETGVATQIIVDWRNLNRQLFLKICIQESESVGGNKLLVELDVFKVKLVQEAKYSETESWIVVGFERGTNKSFVSHIDKPKKSRVLDVMEKYILPESKVLLYCVNGLGIKDFENFETMLQSEMLDSGNHFALVTGAGSFYYVKKKFSEENNHIFHLCEHLWRFRHNSCPDIFKCFLESVSCVFKPSTSGY